MLWTVGKLTQSADVRRDSDHESYNQRVIIKCDVTTEKNGL